LRATGFSARASSLLPFGIFLFVVVDSLFFGESVLFWYEIFTVAGPKLSLESCF